MADCSSLRTQTKLAKILDFRKSILCAEVAEWLTHTLSLNVCMLYGVCYVSVWSICQCTLCTSGFETEMFVSVYCMSEVYLWSHKTHRIVRSYLMKYNGNWNVVITLHNCTLWIPSCQAAVQHVWAGKYMSFHLDMHFIHAFIGEHMDGWKWCILSDLYVEIWTLNSGSRVVVL